MKLSKILFLFSVFLLLFASTYSIAMDAEEAAAKDTISSENSQGSLPFFTRADGEKVLFQMNLDQKKSSQNLLMMERLRKIKEDYQKAKEENSDVCGWLFLDDYLYQPVVDTPSQYDKYLRKNLAGSYDISGTPFLSAESGSNFSGNTLIYGHNMNNLTAFGKLRYLNSAENFQNAPPLITYDGFSDRFLVGKLFTIFYVEDGVEFVNTGNFENDSVRQNYNLSLKDRSEYPVNPDFPLTMSRPAVFLQHCTESFSGENSRRVFGFQTFFELTGEDVSQNEFRDFGQENTGDSL